jgi:RNA polymerase sigma-70 factor (sigma-E family)
VADPPDIGSVFAAHRHGLVRLAVLLVGDPATAEDVVQDAFLGAQRRAAHLHAPGSVLPYARASVVNGCRSVLRRRAVARRLGSAHEPAAWSAEAAAMLSEDRREVVRAMDRLPARRREVLVLRYYLDLTDAEIAAAMGVTEATVRSTVARALRAMGRMLGEEA